VILKAQFKGSIYSSYPKQQIYQKPKHNHLKGTAGNNKLKGNIVLVYRKDRERERENNIFYILYFSKF